MPYWMVSIQSSLIRFGVAVWVVGLLFETVGDFQMALFKSRDDSEGEVMNEGLWRYIWHPNYFGDYHDHGLRVFGFDAEIHVF